MEYEKIDSILIHWYDGSISKKVNVPLNKKISYEIEKSSYKLNKVISSPLFTESETPIIDFIHEENNFVDFDKDRLLFHMSSTEGSCMCNADIDGDGNQDVFIGGAKGMPSSIFLQKENSFKKLNLKIFEDDKESEDTDCILFDANNDGYIDIYVTSGGNESSVYSPELRDRLYFNNKINFFQIRN